LLGAGGGVVGSTTTHQVSVAKNPWPKASWWRSVGERRLRYGVEIPAKSTAGRWQSPPVAAGLTGAVAAAVTPPLSSAQAPAAAPVGYAAKAEDDEEDGDDQLVGAMATDHSGPRAFIETCTLVDYFQAKLVEWVKAVPVNKVFIIGNKNLSEVMDKQDKQDISEISDQIQKKFKLF